MRPQKHYKIEEELTPEQIAWCQDKERSGSVYDAANVLGIHWELVRSMRQRLPKPPHKPKGPRIPDELAEFIENHVDRFKSVTEMSKVLGVSRATIYGIVQKRYYKRETRDVTSGRGNLSTYRQLEQTYLKGR